MSRSLKSPQIESSGPNQTEENSFLPDQGFTFGNFSVDEFEKIFSQNEVSNSAVEFLCDSFNAAKCWVEEEKKSTFSYMGKKKIASKNNETVNEEERSPTKSQLNGPHKTDNEVKRLATSSWASLFKDSSAPVENGVPVVLNGSEAKLAGLLTIQQEQKEQNKENQRRNISGSVSLISMTNDKRALSLAEKVSKLTPNYDRHHLQLRGLINRGNWCYINTTLQALLGISVISHFYKSLKEFVTDSKSTSTPLNDSLIKFFNEFEPINPKISIKKQTEDIRAGTAFEPRFVYDVLPVLKTTLSEKGRQEDAEEFLSFLLNGIHDELVDLRKHDHSPKAPMMNGQLCSDTNLEDINNEDGNEDSWEHVGKNNKASTLRKAVIEESHIKHVFGGVIRSSVFQTGKKESTTLQPFFTLQLDIKDDNIWSLKDALESYFVKENLHGFTCSATNVEVEAFRRISLEELPHVFIFHLKYFVFDREGGCQKLHKPLDIPANLEISKDILSNNAKSRNAAVSRNYKLCAVVYHHGKHAAGGHYTAAVHHGNPFGWINFDDNNIKPVNVNQVTKYNRGCVPYLLFYERLQSR